MDTQYHGIYLPEGDGTPEALFKDADKAQQYRKATWGDKGVVMPTDDWDVNKDAKSALPAAVPDTSAADAALEAKKSQIRSRIWQELEDKKLEDDVRAEVEKSFEKTMKATKEDKDAAKEAADKEEAEVRSRAAIELGKPPEKVTKAEIKEQREREGASNPGNQ